MTRPSNTGIIYVAFKRIMEYCYKMANTKWSDMSTDLAKYSTIPRRVIDKLHTETSEKKNPNGYDTGEVLEKLKTAGYCLEVKARVLQKTEWEKRLQLVEANSPIKQTHERYATP